MHLFVDNLTNVDFSYLHPERGLVGETWLASIVLEGGLDHQGMVCDFGIVKKTLRQWLDTTLDHCLLLPTQAPQLDLQMNPGSTVSLSWLLPSGDYIACTSPREALALINDTELTPDTLAKWCITQLRSQLPETIDQIQLRFEPEVITQHYYHYSHGLKKHQGNCQRIAHGHRSTLEIYQDNERNSQLEQQWSAQWQDIYIGSQEDLVNTRRVKGVDYAVFAYSAQQGEFELVLPRRLSYLIPTDSTVELIAQHIAQTLKQQYPQSRFKVRAFEGIGKGAIGFA
ncbi:MAG: 6-carboxytetrahydropterin synthase [Cellvibrionaceae bacterium]|nr:6-carboxytetrahydropterin synthase [Cellvibrionaceae bacterium]